MWGSSASKLKPSGLTSSGMGSSFLGFRVVLNGMPVARTGQRLLVGGRFAGSRVNGRCFAAGRPLWHDLLRRVDQGVGDFLLCGDYPFRHLFLGIMQPLKVPPPPH